MISHHGTAASDPGSISAVTIVLARVVAFCGEVRMEKEEDRTFSVTSLHSGQLEKSLREKTGTVPSMSHCRDV